GEALDHLESRRLPGAVRAEEAEHLPGGHGQIDAGDGEDLRELLAQPADDDLVGHDAEGYRERGSNRRCAPRGRAATPASRAPPASSSPSPPSGRAERPS